jgi:hypothetical protein
MVEVELADLARIDPGTKKMVEPIAGARSAPSPRHRETSPSPLCASPQCRASVSLM